MGTHLPLCIFKKGIASHVSQEKLPFDSFLSGGLEEIFCESGLCMCKWGYRVTKNADGSYGCMPGGMLSVDLATLSQDEIDTRTAAKSHSDRMATFNVVIAAAW